MTHLRPSFLGPMKLSAPAQWESGTPQSREPHGLHGKLIGRYTNSMSPGGFKLEKTIIFPPVPQIFQKIMESLLKTWSHSATKNPSSCLRALRWEPQVKPQIPREWALQPGFLQWPGHGYELSLVMSVRWLIMVNMLGFFFLMVRNW